MMTSGQAVKYKGSIDCAMQIMKNEFVVCFLSSMVIFLINTCCDHFKIEHSFIGFPFPFFEDNYIFKGK